MSSLRRTASILALVAAALALAACDGGGKQAGATTATATPSKKPPSGSERTPLDPNKTYTVELKTSEGDFTITLDQKTSPKVAASFAALVRKGFFDGTIFHRIVPGFVIQGGDPTGTGTGGPGYTVVDKPPADTKYTKGVVAMAKRGDEPAGASGSQFFVVTGEDAGLEPAYAVLGRVTAGMPVVEKIGKLGDPATQQPTKRIVIDNATLTGD